MPGLFGFISELTPDVSINLLNNMAQALRHEDWYKVDSFVGDEYGLGRINYGDEDQCSQPIWSRDKNFCLFMDGEIFDYDCLREKLIEKGYVFSVDSDAEFALHMFEEFGEDAFLQFNGSFIIAIWNANQRKLIIANDRLGLHPIYYSLKGKSLLFASGIRAILADNSISRQLDPIAITQFLSFDYVLGDRTYLENVKLLPPGSILTFIDEQLNIRPYWIMKFAENYAIQNEESLIEGLLFHLKNAVSRQSADINSAGILLSGGLDSRVLFAFLTEIFNGRELLSITFGVPNCDDVRYARELSKIQKIPHHYFELRPDYLIGLANKGISLTDGFQNCVHMHALGTLGEETKLTRKLFKGYYGDALLGSHLNRGLWGNYSDKNYSDMLYKSICVGFSLEEDKELFNDSFFSQVENRAYDDFLTIVNSMGTNLIADRQNLFDLTQRQRRFILNGVEIVRSQAVVRTPFCDNDLIDYVLQIPPGFRVGRYLMKNAFNQKFSNLAKVPCTDTGYPMISCFRELFMRFDSNARWRLRSMGITGVSIKREKSYADYDLWMRSSLKHWVEEILLSEKTMERGLFRRKFITDLAKEQFSGIDHSDKLGALITIELWLRNNVD
jgi:asparagine synthase (glutamine-hydrolysing)